MPKESSMLKTNAMRIIEKGNIKYKAHEYEPSKGVGALFTAEYLEKSPDVVFKTLVTVAPTHEHFVFVVPGARELDLKKAAKAAGVKSVEMIAQKELLPLTGYVHGGCSPVGMKKAFKTYFDSSALNFDTICLSGGKIGLTLELNAKELADFINAGFAELTM